MATGTATSVPPTWVVVLLAGLVSACGSTATSPPQAPPTQEATVPEPVSCGPVPVGSGPATATARLVLDPPAPGRSGDRLAVSARVQVTGEGPRLVTTGAGSRLLVVDGDRVVASTPGSAGPGVPLLQTAGASRPAQVLPAQVALVDCAGDPLAPGSYALVGVLGYGGDPTDNAQGGASRSFALVSAPVPLTVR